MPADLTVLTCNIPGRDEYLSRNMESVREQSLGVRAHLISSDDATLGAMTKYNELAKAVRTKWLSILDDDNYWFHDHVETIAPYFRDADVIYTWDAGNTRPRSDLTGMSPKELMPLFDGTRNSLDQSCAIRTSMFRKVRGFRNDFAPRAWPDQDLWYRLAEAGARFLAVPKETWFYQTR